MARPAFEHALARARETLSHRPAGLLADLDGVLAPIVLDPAAVQLAPGAAEAIDALAERGVLVVIVTGRAAADARRIVGRDTVLIAGNHGVEWLEPGAEAAELPEAPAALAASLDRALAAVPGLAGVSIDHKGISATVHYRNVADPAYARRQILASLGAVLPQGLELREGRMSVEIRAAGIGDKGSAVRRAVAAHRLRGLIVMGDDVTDLDMFNAATELRGRGRLTSTAVIGVAGSGEVPPAVLAAADAVVASPAQAVELLRRLASG